jgi:single-strand DNA-binding protein
MADINSVVIVGRLTRDADIRYTQGGMAVVKFSIALNSRKKDGDGWNDEAHFIDVDYLGKPAESVHRYLTKGKQIGVAGELRQNRWEKDGENHSKVAILCQSLQLLGGTGESAKAGQAQDAPASGSSPAQEEYTDDIPF